MVPIVGTTGKKMAELFQSVSQMFERSRKENGGPCRGRTYGPLIKSQLLYQLS